MVNCPLCKKASQRSLYILNNAPAFQNQTYDTLEKARNATPASVDLVQCEYCGFAWNKGFDSSIMDYNEDYQNEQGHSEVFQDYLETVLETIGKHISPGERIVEVGCGKAKFLSMLRDRGYDVSGFDPAHEGNDPDVTCAYFDVSLDFPPAKLVVLRHTLEHVENPLHFLHAIRDANGGQGKVFIEVPCFNWIAGKKAFWDIFHEHCNYFTSQSLSSMFTRSESGAVFGDQYLYLIADFSNLRDTASENNDHQLVDPKLFSGEIARLRSFVESCGQCLIWGAGAKGAAFAHLTDPERKRIQAVIDINPRKQGGFLGMTGHPILGPECLDHFQGIDVIIMNENYRDEISRMAATYNAKLHILGDIQWTR